MALAGLLAASAVVSPPYRGPDESQHVDLVLAVAEGKDPLWEPRSGRSHRGVAEAGIAPGGRLAERQHLADSVPEHRPATFDELGLDEVVGPNQLTQHPPGYYLLMAGVLQLVPDWQQQDTWAVLMALRLTGALLLVPLPLLAALTARRLTSDPVVPAAAAWSVVAVPQIPTIGSSVNNDNLLVLACAAFVALGVRVCGGEVRWRTTLLGGAALGVGLAAKGLALAFVPLLGLAFLVAVLRGAPLVRAVVHAGAGYVVALALGGWWWVRNVVLYGQVQPAGVELSTAAVRGWAEGGAQWLENFVWYVNARFWFASSSGEVTPVAGALAVVAGVAAVVLTAVGVVALARRGRADLATAVFLLLPVLLLAGVLATGSWQAFTTGRDQPALQGRYLFGGLTAWAALAALAWVRLWGPRARPALLVVLGWAALCQSVAFGAALRDLWLRRDGSVPGTVDAMLGLPGAPVAVVLGALGVAAGVVAVLGTVRGHGFAERDAGSDGPPGPVTVRT